MSHQKHLVVLEGRWYDQYNVSLRGTFDLLSDLLYDTPHGYYHESFCDRHSLAGIIERVGAWPETRVLYVGAHGTESALQGSLDGDAGLVKRGKLRRALLGLDRGYHGLFVSACAFMTSESAVFMLSKKHGEYPAIKWVAGYSTDVDFIESTALELFFLKHLLEDYEPGAWVRSLDRACENISESMRGLVRSTGFRVYRRKDHSNEIVPVVEPSAWA